MKEIGYLVSNFYKGCHREKEFTDKGKLRAYMKRQAALGHTHIAWCSYVDHPFDLGRSWVIGLVPE